LETLLLKKHLGSKLLQICLIQIISINLNGANLLIVIKTKTNLITRIFTMWMMVECYLRRYSKSKLELESNL